MPPVLTAFWKKLNGNEKLVGYGAVLIIVGLLIGPGGVSLFC